MAGGRPTKYNPKFHPLLAEALAASGKTVDQIADKIGVHRDTIFDWQNKHPEFSDALKKGKEGPDDKVERSLFERATGYTFDSEKIVTISLGQGMGSEVERVAIEEHCPPDVTAQIFWLKNRRPDRWREKQETELSGALNLHADDGLTVILNGITPAEPKP